MKLRLNKSLIILSILVSYFSLSFYNPIHISEMNNVHDMPMPGEECPFIFAQNIFCNTFVNKNHGLINQNNTNNILTNHFIMKMLLLSIYLSVFYKFLVFCNKNQKEYKIPILLTQLFSRGILNTKVHLK